VSSLLNLQTHTDKRGNLTVIEKIIPFEIKRIFYIYGVDNSTRGYHRHKKTIQAAIAIQGKCRIVSKSGVGCPEEEYILDTPSKCLMLQPEDFHWMDNFSKDCILMVLASENFDKDDYIFTPYTV
jgi:dTDP-4-dehydrorhamnose 3,5-epimerase-like enzyme